MGLRAWGFGFWVSGLGYESCKRPQVSSLLLATLTFRWCVQCLMPASGVTCICTLGYRHTDEGELCGACAEGFEGYPDCRKQDSEEFRERQDDGEGAGGAGGGCSLPALPRNLNGKGMLDFEEGDGSLHLQDDYWLDVRSRSHVMHLAIATPSLLHLRVDTGTLAGELGVAVAVEQLVSTVHGTSTSEGRGSQATGTDRDSEGSKVGGNHRRLIWEPLTALERGGAMVAGEGFVEAVLRPPQSIGPNPSAAPAASSRRYRIVLAYEILGELQGGEQDELCRALGLQLAVTPLRVLRTIAESVDAACPADAASRILKLPGHIDVSPQGWSTNGTFFINVNEPGTRPMRMGTAIQPVTIRIPDVPGKVARLSGVVGYRFELSSFGLLLEAERTEGPGSEINIPRCQATKGDEAWRDSGVQPGSDAGGGGHW